MSHVCTLSAFPTLLCPLSDAPSPRPVTAPPLPFAQRPPTPAAPPGPPPWQLPPPPSFPRATPCPPPPARRGQRLPDAATLTRRLTLLTMSRLDHDVQLHPATAVIASAQDDTAKSFLTNRVCTWTWCCSTARAFDPVSPGGDSLRGTREYPERT